METRDTAKLDEALFKLPYSAYLIRAKQEGSEFSEWQLEPVMGPTLSAAYVPYRALQGDFIVAAKSVGRSGVLENCYMDVILPERISEHHFRLQNGRIARERGTHLTSTTIIPAIAIEAVGNYRLYLAKDRIDEGIEILRDGLSHGRDRVPIALDLAYLLRDAARIQEAADTFTIAIKELHVDDVTRCYCLRERAALYDRLGQKQKAEEDRLQAASLQRPANLC